MCVYTFGRVSKWRLKFITEVTLTNVGGGGPMEEHDNVLLFIELTFACTL